MLALSVRQITKGSSRTCRPQITGKLRHRGYDRQVKTSGLSCNHKIPAYGQSLSHEQSRTGWSARKIASERNSWAQSLNGRTIGLREHPTPVDQLLADQNRLELNPVSNSEPGSKEHLPLVGLLRLELGRCGGRDGLVERLAERAQRLPQRRQPRRVDLGQGCRGRKWNVRNRTTRDCGTRDKQ